MYCTQKSLRTLTLGEILHKVVQACIGALLSVAHGTEQQTREYLMQERALYFLGEAHRSAYFRCF